MLIKENQLDSYKKNILLFGSTGRLGRNIFSEIKNKEEFNLITAGRSNNSLVDFKIDITNSNGIKDLVKKVKPKIIINCIALTNVDYCETNQDLAYQINYLFPKDLSKILNEINENIKLIHISTDQVYISSNWSVVGNEMPLNIYSVSKFKGDNEVLKYKKGLIIRTNFLWNNTFDSPVNWLIQKCKSKEKFFLFDDIIINPVEIRFLSSIIAELISINIFGIYNIGSSSSLSKAKIFIKIAKKLNLNISKAEFCSIKKAKLKAIRPQIMTMSISNIERDTNFKMPSINKTISSLFD